MKLVKFALFVAAARWSSFCDAQRAQNLRQQKDSMKHYSAAETPRTKQAETRSVKKDSPVLANKQEDRRKLPETVDEPNPRKQAKQRSDEGNPLVQHERALDGTNPATDDLGVARKKALAHQKNQQLKEQFQKRRSTMQVKATTVTDNGQIIDWIDPTTLLPPGSTLAEPPESPARRLDLADDEAGGGDSLFELHRQLHARGPEGTVPMLRRDIDFSLLSDDQLPNSVEDFLSKYGKKDHRPVGHLNMTHSPKQNISEGHHRQLDSRYIYRYASTLEKVSNFGGEGYINTWDTYISEYGEYSLAEFAVRGGKTIQSAEVGYHKYPKFYGDSFPHLFTYFTVDNYYSYGDYKGGYNVDIAGFVQVSTTIFPGAVITSYGLCTYGGRQYDMQVKVKLDKGNWWIWVFDHWIGYYPGTLYAKDGLLVGGQEVEWYGAVREVPNSIPTQTWMGSGLFPSKGKGYAAYMRNIKTYRTDCNCTANYSPDSCTVTNSNCYSLVVVPKSCTSWGSYFYFGGPGAYNNPKCSHE